MESRCRRPLHLLKLQKAGCLNKGAWENKPHFPMPLFVITQHRVSPAPPLGWQRKSRLPLRGGKSWLPLRGSCRRLRGCIQPHSGGNQGGSATKIHPLARFAGLTPEGEARTRLPLRGSWRRRRLRGCISPHRGRIYRRLRHLKIHPFARFAGLPTQGSISLISQSPDGSLRNQFACHPEGGSKCSLDSPVGGSKTSSGYLLPRYKKGHQEMGCIS